MEVKELGGPLSINSTFLWGSTILTIFILFSARTWLLDKSGHFIMKHRGRFSEGFKVPSSKNNSYACKQSSLLVFPHLKSGPNQYAKWTDELGLLYNQIYLWIIGWSLKRIFGCTGWFSHKWQLPRFFSHPQYCSILSEFFCVFIQTKWKHLPKIFLSNWFLVGLGQNADFDVDTNP